MQSAVPNPFSRGSATQAASSILQLLGPELLRRDGRRVPTDVVTADVIGIYFSAHWCPPCRGFTPRLKALYEQAREAQKSFEVIFVSSDKTEPQFSQYFAEMGDWLAVPFEPASSRQSLGMSLGVRGIPTLILLHGRSGQISTMEGRNEVLLPSFVGRLPLDVDEEALSESRREFASLESLVEATGELSRSTLRNGLRVLRTAFSNILREPETMRFRSLKKSNAAVAAKLGAPPLLALLKAGGFRERADAYVCWRPRMGFMREALSTLEALLESFAVN